MQLRHKTYALFVLVALSLGMPFSAISGTAATESSSNISNLFATRSAKIAGVSGIGATAFAVLCLKAHKKMVAAETVNPQSMLAQKARSRFEKLRATALAFLLTATAAGTHAYMSPASDDTVTDLAAAKPSLTDDKSGDKATVPGTITPPPSAKGTGVVKKKDKAKGDNSEADEDGDDSGEESEEELIEPEKPLSAAEKAKRVAAATAQDEQLRSQAEALQQRKLAILNEIEREVQTRMQAARDALATHDGYQAWLTSPENSASMAALRRLRRNDQALDKHLSTLGIALNGVQNEYGASLAQHQTLVEKHPELEGIEKSLQEIYKKGQGLHDEMENLEITGIATLTKRLNRAKDKKEKLAQTAKPFEASFQSLLESHPDIATADEAVANIQRTSGEFATKFGEGEPTAQEIESYLNAPWHYGDSDDKERLAAYEVLGQLDDEACQSVVGKLASFDKNIEKLYRQTRKLRAAKRKRKRLKAEIELLKIEHLLARKKTKFDAVEKAQSNLEAARKSLTAKAKLEPEYANARDQQNEARALLERAHPGFVEAYEAYGAIAPYDYMKRECFEKGILVPLLNRDVDGTLNHAWYAIDSEQTTLERLRMDQEANDPEYIAAEAAFQEAINPERNGSNLFEEHKNLLEQQQRWKAFLARRKI